MADCREEGDALEADLLGLFEGCSRVDPPPETPDQFPRIRLFIDNLWDYAQGDARLFKEEVRVTFLHELGHYLGFDEAAVEELGLE
jgi:predicted Zn-dependent protease with MMP-like domain